MILSLIEISCMGNSNRYTMYANLKDSTIISLQMMSIFLRISFILQFIWNIELSIASQCACATDNVHVRSGAGTTHNILGTLNTGSCVTYKEHMMSATGYQWANVDYHGQVSEAVPRIIILYNTHWILDIYCNLSKLRKHISLYLTCDYYFQHGHIGQAFKTQIPIIHYTGMLKNSPSRYTYKNHIFVLISFRMDGQRRITLPLRRVHVRTQLKDSFMELI